MRDVLKTIMEKEHGNKVNIGSKASGNELFAYLKEVLPEYSKESVYASDVKKLISWYNILMENKIDLDEAEKPDEASSETTETVSE